MDTDFSGYVDRDEFEVRAASGTRDTPRAPTCAQRTRAQCSRATVDRAWRVRAWLQVGILAVLGEHCLHSDIQVRLHDGDLDGSPNPNPNPNPHPHPHPNPGPTPNPNPNLR